MGMIRRTQTTWRQRVARTQAIMSAAWQLLKEQKQLLLLPIASSVCLLLHYGRLGDSAILGVFADTSWPDAARQSESLSSWAPFLFLRRDVRDRDFFNAALAICVYEDSGKSVRFSTA